MHAPNFIERIEFYNIQTPTKRYISKCQQLSKKSSSQLKSLYGHVAQSTRKSPKDDQKLLKQIASLKEKILQNNQTIQENYRVLNTRLQHFSDLSQSPIQPKVLQADIKRLFTNHCIERGYMKTALTLLGDPHNARLANTHFYKTLKKLIPKIYSPGVEKTTSDIKKLSKIFDLGNILKFSEKNQSSINSKDPIQQTLLDFYSQRQHIVHTAILDFCQGKIDNPVPALLYLRKNVSHHIKWRSKAVEHLTSFLFWWYQPLGNSQQNSISNTDPGFAYLSKIPNLLDKISSLPPRYQFLFHIDRFEMELFPCLVSHVYENPWRPELVCLVQAGISVLKPNSFNHPSSSSFEAEEEKSKKSNLLADSLSLTTPPFFNSNLKNIFSSYFNPSTARKLFLKGNVHFCPTNLSEFQSFVSSVPGVSTSSSILYCRITLQPMDSDNFPMIIPVRTKYRGVSCFQVYSQKAIPFLLRKVLIPTDVSKIGYGTNGSRFPTYTNQPYETDNHICTQIVECPLTNVWCLESELIKGFVV